MLIELVPFVEGDVFRRRRSSGPNQALSSLATGLRGFAGLSFAIKTRRICGLEPEQAGLTGGANIMSVGLPSVRIDSAVSRQLVPQRWKP